MKLFKRKAPFVILDEGPLSGKIVLVGTIGKKPTFGAIRICRYKDGKLHEYGNQVTEDDIGETLVTILFGAKEGVKKLSDSLSKLYCVLENMEAET